jgi:predicted RNase H-like nuclease (RuvC/YqgF family)
LHFLKNNLATILLVVIVALVLYIIWGQPSTPKDDYEREILKLEEVIDSYKAVITTLDSKSDSLMDINNMLLSKNDSLNKAKVKVKTQYREVYITINHASNYQLDSVIRANW